MGSGRGYLSVRDRVTTAGVRNKELPSASKAFYAMYATRGGASRLGDIGTQVNCQSQGHVISMSATTATSSQATPARNQQPRPVVRLRCVLVHNRRIFS